MFASIGSCTSRIAFGTVLVALGVAACSGDPCTPGTEGCSCDKNDTCGDSLTCASHLCVHFAMGGSGTGTASGGSSSASIGGTSSTGGATTLVSSTVTGGLVATGGTTAAFSGTNSSGTILGIGGAAASGGAQALGGIAATGGATTAGGTTTTVGGAQGTGGIQALGGAMATGGATSAGGDGQTSGGVPTTGGNPQTSGGAQALGGTTTTGGTPTSGGGVQTSGGVPTTGGSAQSSGGVTGGNSGTGGSTSQVSDCTSQLSQALAPCSAIQIEPVTATSNILLVLDASGSMSNAASSSLISKWSALKSAVGSVLSSAPSNLHFGLELFPYGPEGISFDTTDPAVACQVPDGDAAIAVDIDPELPTRQSISTTLASYSPAGGTPTAAALRQAYAYFTTGAGKDLKGPRWALLVSDGGPNCHLGLACDTAHCTQNIDCKCGNGCGETMNCCAPSGREDYGYICLDDTETILAVDRLMAVGVRTFVVGLEGSEKFATTFTNLALAGGAPNPETAGYYAVAGSSGTAGIEQALQAIIARAGSSCDIPLTTYAANMTDTNLAIDCSLIPQSFNGGATTNWTIDTTQTPPHLKLGTSACDAARVSVGAGLQLVTGCPTVSQ